LGGDLRPYTWEELVYALNIVLADTQRCFLLIIDGLDEFEGKSDEVAELAIDLSRRPNVKVCAASRPWPVFEDKFDERPMLKIEDLTRRDIVKYISGKFKSSRPFSKLQRINPANGHRLVEEVARRAKGVFLWVYVVVQSLLEGLTDGDTARELEERLSELPIELEELFDKIIRHLNPRYRKQASEMFQFVRGAPEDASLMAMVYSQASLDEALATPIEPLSDEDFAVHSETMRRRIYSRCKCLLEVEKNAGRQAKVTWLHRTAREYLTQPSVWKTIELESPCYQLRRALAVSLLQLAKGIEPDTIDPSGTKFREALVRSVIYAAELPEWSSEDKIAFIDEAEKTGRHIYNRITAITGRVGLHAHESWLSAAGSIIIPHEIMHALSRCRRPANMLELAMAAGYNWYIPIGLQTGGSLLQERVNGRYLLIAAVEYRAWPLVSLLLKNNANPNYYQAGDSAWTILLRSTQAWTVNRQGCDGDHPYLVALELFLDHEADPRVNVAGVSVSSVINQACTTMQQDRYKLA
jgi:hypothetical protein